MKNIRSNTSEVLKNIPSIDLIILDCYKNHNISFHYSLLKKIVKDEIKSIKSEIINGSIVDNIKDNLYQRIFILQASILLSCFFAK